MVYHIGETCYTLEIFPYNNGMKKYFMFKYKLSKKLYKGARFTRIRMQKKSKLLIISLIIVIILPLAVLGVYLSGLEEPEVEIRDIVFKSIDPETESIIFLVTVDVRNPNNIDATVISLFAEVYIDFEFVGMVNQDVNEEIKANSNKTIELEFYLYNVPPIHSQVIEVYITGSARVKVSIISFTIPIDKTEEVNIMEELNQPPTAVIIDDAPLITRTGRSITFDGSLSMDTDGSITLYEWDFGDGSPIETDQTVSHAYQSRGQYSVELIVYDNWNASDSDSTVIRVIGIG